MSRILVVDDDALSRAVLLDAVRSLGHEVVVVASGADALARLREETFDLVISDVAMPEMDGVELARRIAARPVPIPVVLVSAAGRPPSGTVPIAGFVAKPLDSDRLGRAIDAVRAAAAAPRSVEWSGSAFLAAVAGPIERFPPVRVLFLAHRVAASGALRVVLGDTTALVGLRNGKVVDVLGVPGLFASVAPSAGDRLMDGLGVAVAAGHPVDHALAGACDGLGVWLASLVSERGGRVTFDAEWTPPPGRFPLPASVPRILARGLSLGRSDAAVARAWRELELAPLACRAPEDSPEESWGLDATTLRVLRLAPRTPTVDALIRQAAGADRARRPEILRAVDTLEVLGLLVVAVGDPDDEPAEEPQAAAVLAPTAKDPRAERLAVAAAALADAHPIEILELEGRLQVTDEDVANAYREVSRRYHPDTFFSAPPEVRVLAESCFSRVNLAYDALRLPGGLADARRFLESKAKGTAFVSEKELRAAKLAFRKGEAAFRAREWKAADPHFEEAASIDAATWPHLLMATYCGWLARRVPPLAALATLASLAPPEPSRAAEVLVYMGNVLKQEDREAEAMKQFRAAAQKDPMNHDAQRELRLYEARNPTPPPRGGGLFGGILGRKAPK
jgi:CheY-like chemotaxis protein